ncbi:MAG: hypothetical protein HY902_08950 [Deltaproteobacteria bacterium]|nr:hypothetical protein [Deltaproteobacteria bacterium]
MMARNPWYLAVLAAGWLLTACMPDRKSDEQIKAEAAAQGDTTALADADASLADTAPSDAEDADVALDAAVDGAGDATADAQVDADPADSLPDGDDAADAGDQDAADAGDDATAVADSADAGDGLDPGDGIDAANPSDTVDAADGADGVDGADSVDSADSADAVDAADSGDGSGDAADAPDGSADGDGGDASSSCLTDQDCPSGNVCQVAACVSGSCTLTALSCEDGNACTADSCATGTGCAHSAVANGSACSTNSLCTLGDSCQAGVCTSLPAVWDKALGSTGEEHLLAVDAVTGGAVVAGSTNRNGPWEAWLVKVDDSGKVLLDKTYGASGESHSGMDVATLADGSLALAVAVNAGGKLKSRLLHVSASGTVLGEITFADVDVQGVAAVPGGGAVFVGRLAEGGADKGWAARVDAGWGSLWDKEFGSNGSALADVAVANNMVWMVGRASAALTGVDQAWVLRTDVSGTVQLDKVLTTLLPRSLAGVSVAAQGGEIIAVGHSGGLGDSGLLLRVDAAGAAKWDKEFSSGSSYFLGAAATFPVSASNGGALAVGSSKPGSNNQLWLARIQQTGYQAWQKSLGGTGVEVGRDLVLQSHTLWIVGDTTSIGAGGSDGWLLRLDVFGNGTCTTSGPCSTIGQSACDDGIPCTADVCTAATYADKCPKGGCDAYKGCASSAIALCAP